MARKEGMPGGDGEERREEREVPVGSPWRGRNPPHVAKVSSWVWRTPEGPLRASEVAAMEPARLLSLSKGQSAHR